MIAGKLPKLKVYLNFFIRFQATHSKTDELLVVYPTQRALDGSSVVVRHALHLPLFGLMDWTA